MKNARFAVAIAAALILCGFSLVEYQHGGRTTWFTTYLGPAYNTAAPEETNFSHCFYPRGYAGAFGPGIYRSTTITCSWGIAGTDAGANGVDVKLVHEDGGIDCQCNLGGCGQTANTQVVCSCPADLGRTIQPDGGEALESTVCLQLDDATDCATNPAAMACSVDLFH